MLLAGLVIAGGALYTGAKVYKKRRKGKKLGLYLQAGKKIEHKADFHNFDLNPPVTFIGERDRQQLQEIPVAAAKREISAYEKANNRKLTLSLTLLSMPCFQSQYLS